MTSPFLQRIAIVVAALSMWVLFPAAVSGQSPTPEPEVISTVGGIDLLPGLAEPMEGVIESPEHEAGFWFDAVSGDHVRLHAAATDRSLDPVLELYGPGGVWLETDDDGLGLDATIASQLDVSGRYQVVVRSAGYGSSGPFTLDFDIRSAKPLLPGGGPVEGSTPADGYPDPYFIDLAAGERVGIRLVADASDTWLEIIGPADEPLAASAGYPGTAAWVDLTAREPGRYRVDASLRGGSGMGSYVIEVFPDGVAQLADGVWLQGDLSESAANAQYAFATSPGLGQLVTVSSDTFVPQLTITGPNGSWVAGSDGGYDEQSGAFEARAMVTPGGEGEYRATVSSYDGNLGRFSILAEPVSANLLEWGVPVDAQLGESGSDSYIYDGRRDESISVTMSSDELDSFLRVVGPDGQEIASDDDSGGGSNGLDARVDLYLPTDGIYEVIASSVGGSGSGTYRIRVESDR